MAARSYRCGTSNASRAEAEKEEQKPLAKEKKSKKREEPKDVEPERLRSSLLMPDLRLQVNEYRILAVMEDGETALFCMGATRKEVLDLARELKEELTKEIEALRLEKWVGNAYGGFWQSQRTKWNELPAIPGKEDKKSHRRHRRS